MISGRSISAADGVVASHKPERGRLDEIRFPSASSSVSSSKFFYVPSLLASFFDWSSVNRRLPEELTSLTAGA